MRRVTLTVYLVLMILVIVVGAEAAVKYQVTSLGTHSPTDINNSGVIVGSGFIFQDGKYTPLPNMDYVYAVNDSGHVVGTKFVIGGHYTGVIYRDGQYEMLGAPPGQQYTTPHALNNSDKVVGTWETWNNGTITGGFVWENSINSDTGLGGAYGINKWGDYVGGSTFSGPAYVVRDGTVTHLSLEPGPKASCAYDINDTGQVVVQAKYGGGVKKAYLWDLANNGSTIEIRQPGSYSDVLPNAINNQGTVIGDSYGYPGNRAFVWQNGTFEYLDDVVDRSLGWKFNYAHGINDKGQIVGSGTRNSQWSGFLLTPVPEPSSLFVLLTGGLMVCGHMKRAKNR